MGLSQTVNADLIIPRRLSVGQLSIFATSCQCSLLPHGCARTPQVMGLVWAFPLFSFFFVRLIGEVLTVRSPSVSTPVRLPYTLRSAT